MWIRYQYLGPNGIKWTKWFKTINNSKTKYQYKDSRLTLLNEYSDVKPEE